MTPVYRLVVIPEDDRLESVNAYLWAVTCDGNQPEPDKRKFVVVADNADDAIHIAVGRSGLSPAFMTVKRATFADLDAVTDA